MFLCSYNINQAGEYHNHLFHVFLNHMGGGEVGFPFPLLFDNGPATGTIALIGNNPCDGVSDVYEIKWLCWERRGEKT